MTFGTRPYTRRRRAMNGAIMEDKSAFTIALECEHQSSRDDSTCWACTVKMFEHDAEETRRAARLEAELTAARTAAGIEAGMPLDEWIKAQREDHATMTRKLDEWKAAHSDACRLLDTVQDQRDEARRHAADLAFERAQKIGATYVIDETPLGHWLDGQGDEVEP